MKKRLNRALKLSKETLRTLDEYTLSGAQGGATAICTVHCPSGTACSCPQTEISCETCFRC